MAPYTLNEREFELINIIGAQLGSNQRDLSHHLELSIGMTNMLIRRLAAKGYIRIRQLDKRKVEYILTPKGFAEKMRKSIKYTLNTINSVGLIRQRLKKVILKLHEKGEKNFTILGESDFTLLVDTVLKEIYSGDYTVTKVKEMPAEKFPGTLLICTEGYENGKGHIENSINLLEELAKEHNFSQRDAS